MSEPLESLRKKALSMPEQERASLAKTLIESLESSDSNDDSLWIELAEERLEGLNTGQVQSITWSEVKSGLSDE